jgi:hypothetical protein
VPPPHNGYVQAPSKSSPFDRPPALSRRSSDQDVVLPSVEPEAIDLASPRRVASGHFAHPVAPPPPRGYDLLHSPKRKAIMSFPDGRDNYSGPDPKRPRPLYYEDGLPSRVGHMQMSRPPVANTRPPMDVHSLPRADPQQTYIDLTSSPRQPPPNRDNGYRLPAYAHGAAGPCGISYVPATSRRSPTREVRGAMYEVHSGEAPRAYIPNSGMYERRAPPVRDFVPMQNDQHRRPVDDGGRYLRSGLHYGGPDLH